MSLGKLIEVDYDSDGNSDNSILYKQLENKEEYTGE